MAKHNKILLVDDDLNLHRLVKTALESSDCDVIACDNPVQAFEILKTFVPDIIISDIMMPEMDGIEFFNKLTKISQFETIPFLFLTASKDDSVAEEVMSRGAIDFLIKPYNLKALKAKVQSLLRLRKASQKTAFIDRGDLRETPLMDILQFCEDNTFTGILRIRHEDQDGVFAFDRGALANAKLGDMSQEESLDEMLQWEDGEFQLEQKQLRITTSETPRVMSDMTADEELPAGTEPPATTAGELTYYDYFEYGLQSFYEGDYADAKAYWENALALKPGDVRMTQNLKLVNYKLK